MTLAEIHAPAPVIHCECQLSVSTSRPTIHPGLSKFVLVLRSYGMEWLPTFLFYLIFVTQREACTCVIFFYSCVDETLCHLWATLVLLPSLLRMAQLNLSKLTTRVHGALSPSSLITSGDIIE